MSYATSYNPLTGHAASLFAAQYNTTFPTEDVNGTPPSMIKRVLIIFSSKF